MYNNEISIRPIEPDDLEFVKGVLNEVIANHDFYLSEYPKSEADIRQWYDDHQNSDLYGVFVAEIEGKPAGWVSLSNFRSIDGYDVSAELSIYVSPCYYRAGVAGVMMEYIEQFARVKNRLHKIISVITATNLASIALHQKYGFETEGFLKEVAMKNGKYHDVVFMSKIISHI